MTGTLEGAPLTLCKIARFVNVFSKTVGDKIDTEKSVALLYTKLIDYNLPQNS